MDTKSYPATPAIHPRASPYPLPHLNVWHFNLWPSTFDPTKADQQDIIDLQSSDVALI